MCQISEKLRDLRINVQKKRKLEEKGIFKDATLSNNSGIYGGVRRVLK